MKKIISSGLLLLVSTAHGGTMGEIYTPSSPWTFEFGPRYWLSLNNYKHNLVVGNNILSHSGSGNLASRLTYDNLLGNSAEGFWMLSHDNGVFLKGYFGGGSISGGDLINEDFPGNLTDNLYNNTISKQKYGSMQYLSADLGYQFYSAPYGNIKGFIGYHYWNEGLYTFGCRQQAEGTFCIPVVPTTVNGLNHELNWNSLRVGVNSIINFSETLNLYVDAAYIRSYFKAFDYHVARIPLKGLTYDGKGNGVQLDAILNWMLTHNLSAGIGGRWWYTKTDGFTRFERTTIENGQPQHSEDIQNSYGLILQANYKFDSGNRISADAASYVWPGAYMGINLGYGSNSNIVNITPVTPDAQILHDNNSSPINLNVHSKGFLAGAEVGYHWQFNTLISGIEADLDYASVGGVDAVKMPKANITTTAEKELSWLATIRGRFGKLASSNMLVYLTAGSAFGQVKSAFDQRNTAVSCFTNFPCTNGFSSKKKAGWTVGTGLEYAVSTQTTFKAEYLYVDLGSMNHNTQDSSVPPDRTGPINYSVNSKFNYNILRLGINFKV